MTLIVGYVDENGNGHMAADSNGTSVDYHATQEYKASKIFTIGDGKFLIGYTTSFRMGQIIEHCFIPPPHVEGISNVKYMINEFMPKLIQSFRDNRYILDTEKSGGTFLVYYNGSLFKIYNDFQIQETVNNFDACGSGEMQALASFNTIKLYDKWNENIELHLNNIIKIVSENNITVRGRIDYLTVLLEN